MYSVSERKWTPAREAPTASEPSIVSMYRELSRGRDCTSGVTQLTNWGIISLGQTVVCGLRAEIVGGVLRCSRSISGWSSTSC